MDCRFVISVDGRPSARIPCLSTSRSSLGFFAPSHKLNPPPPPLPPLCCSLSLSPSLDTPVVGAGDDEHGFERQQQYYVTRLERVRLG